MSRKVEAGARPAAGARRATRSKLVLVTGLSGSGKSSVGKCFEDLGYYTVDNLPLPLLRRFLADPLGLIEGWSEIAVVTDVRAPGFERAFPELVAEIDRSRVEPTVLFLEASDEALMRRFSETRRPHPLSGDASLIDSIRRERELLADVRGLADLVIDTSEWSIHEIRGHVFKEFAGEAGLEPRMVISLVSFGFKHGIPYGTDLMFDLRFLPNPNFVPELQELTGEDPAVREYLERQEEFPVVLDRLRDFLLDMLPRYRRENRSYLTIGIGCTGGRHRSVAASERLKSELDAAGWPVRLIHRDVER